MSGRTLADSVTIPYLERTPFLEGQERLGIVGSCGHSWKKKAIALPERCQHFVSCQRLSRVNLLESNRCRQVACNGERPSDLDRRPLGGPVLHQSQHPENVYAAVSFSIKQ